MEKKETYGGAAHYKGLDYENPKYFFIKVGDYIENIVRKRREKKQYDLLDVGGASGAFCYYINKRFANVKTTVLEYDKELCRIGKKMVPHTKFINGDANNMTMIKNGAYDITTCFGVIPIFDEFRPCLNELVRVTVKGGAIFVFNIFNDYPIDCLIKYRRSGGDKRIWHTGFNFFSQKSIGEFLKTKRKVRSFFFEKFILPFDIPEQDDPVRAWTEMRNGERIHINGIMPLNIKILTIDL